METRIVDGCKEFSIPDFEPLLLALDHVFNVEYKVGTDEERVVEVALALALRTLRNMRIEGLFDEDHSW